MSALNMIDFSGKGKLYFLKKTSYLLRSRVRKNNLFLVENNLLTENNLLLQENKLFSAAPTIRGATTKAQNGKQAIKYVVFNPENKLLTTCFFAAMHRKQAIDNLFPG